MVERDDSQKENDYKKNFYYFYLNRNDYSFNNYLVIKYKKNKLSSYMSSHKSIKRLRYLCSLNCKKKPR